MNQRIMITLITMAVVLFWIAFSAHNVIAQPAEDTEGVQEASKGFYTALTVLDNGEAMYKVWAHTPYITFVGPRSKSVIVGWDAQKKYWLESNKLFLLRDIVVLDQQIHANGNLAWETGRETGDVKMANGTTSKISNMVTNVYEKLDGRWLIVSHHAQPTPK
jgi:ketosteroid isomerase-like protein